MDESSDSHYVKSFFQTSFLGLLALMLAKLKLAAYGLLLIVALWFAWGFHVNYSAITPEAAVDASGSRKLMIFYFAGLIFAIVGLGILIACDVVRQFACRTVDMLFDDDDGPATKDPEYERAEQVWAAGRPMEAVELMRDYLKRNPCAQYAALRIAEIYEKDFRNYLAAAMEYEEILKRKLSSDRWGWAAIHLCNLYSKLGRQVEYDALLRKIVNDHPKTSAAKKARQALGWPEEISAPDAPIHPGNAQFVQADPSSDLTDTTIHSNLPPGFRPKKQK